MSLSCSLPEECLKAARGIKGVRLMAMKGSQSCGASDPTAGTLTYIFSGVTYRSPDQHASPGKLVADSKPTMPAFLPFTDTGVNVSQGWIYGNGGFHSSVDYGNGNKSFTVHSIAAGKVIHNAWNQWHGNVVIVEHSTPGVQPFCSMYFHLRNGMTNDIIKARQTRLVDFDEGSDGRDKAERYKKYADLAYGGTTHWGTNSHKIKVKVGDRVSSGQQIGWVGNTGIGGASAMLQSNGKPANSGTTNIHLHFMIASKDDGKWYFVDPYGAYSKATSCYNGTGKGANAHYFAPFYPYYHNVDASLFQVGFEYYAQMGYAPTDFTFHRRGQLLRVSGIFEKSNEGFIVHHGMTESTYIKNWEKYRKKGFRPHKQCVYPARNGSPRFACIWRPVKGEGWESYHRLTPQQFNVKVNNMAKQGYRLTDFSVYSKGKNLRVAAIWAKDPKVHYVWWGLTSAAFNSKFKELGKKGFALTHFEAYKTGSATRYGGIWTKGIFKSFMHWYGLTSNGYQSKFNLMAKQGWRLMEVVGYSNSMRFSGLWTKGVKGEPQLR